MATRCRSLAEIAALGREARNCLPKDWEVWQQFAADGSDVWAVREEGVLVAVLGVDRDRSLVRQAHTPQNGVIDIRDAGRLARLCREMRLGIAGTCEGLHDAFVPDPVVLPCLIPASGRLAFYAEWPAGARIDLSPVLDPRPRGHRVMRRLVLAFDLDGGLAVPAPDAADWNEVLFWFGHERLRSVADAVTARLPEPTLVRQGLRQLAHRTTRTRMAGPAHIMEQGEITP